VRLASTNSAAQGDGMWVGGMRECLCAMGCRCAVLVGPFPRLRCRFDGAGFWLFFSLGKQRKVTNEQGNLIVKFPALINRSPNWIKKLQTTCNTADVMKQRIGNK
jgi:hypothetical protein